MILKATSRPLSSAAASISSAAAAAAVADLPTRHSWKQPPKVCQDLKELEESTSLILEGPVGCLYALAANKSVERSDIYDVADATIQQVEYLIRGHSSNVPGSLYSRSTAHTSNQAQHHLDKMKQLLGRVQKEGSMCMQLRQEKLNLSADADVEDSDSSSSSSSSSDEDDDNDFLDFAPPGATIAMYDAVLDAMAVIPNSNNFDPLDFFHTSMQALSANELDTQYLFHRDQLQIPARDTYTLVTPITYHAALRGISNKTNFENPKHRDYALNAAFGLYNHLTHSEHLVRNNASILYMAGIVDKALPASRVKGNISVTLWKQACQIGVVSPNLVQVIQKIHMDSSCGPEFDVFLKQLAMSLDDLPQKYRRFAKKYMHSKDY
jgi:hypothetical protein